ncbi:MAG TPA: hypothetical protein VLC95_16970, partial [Anaerolineae bacterium]|nr:hypothetical protein [Anaerolineae bacterium]
MADVDYTFHVSGPPPAGYPAAPFPDLYDAEPFAATRRARRQTYLAHVARNPAPANLKAPYYELARLAAGGQPHLGVFYAGLDYIEARRDCADFVLHAILRLLHQFSGWMPAALRDRARDVLLGFQYWPDECGPIWSGAAESGPAERGAAGCVAGEMCTWTENHQILFAAGAYLAGHLFPDDLFAASGRTGRDQAMHHAPRIRRWLQLRFETGFSEWLSHVYYDEDIVALLSLVDFGPDTGIARRAAIVLDLLLFDVALNSFRGILGCTHGRAYEAGKKRLAGQPMADTLKLLFGTGLFALRDNMSAPCLALSERYRMPRVLYDVANDHAGAPGAPAMINRQHIGLRLAEAERWVPDLYDLEDGFVLLSLEAYTHPRTINLFVDMLDAYGWWDNPFFEPFAARRGRLQTLRRFHLLPLVARIFERDVTRNTREQVDVYTYRTPDYLLSSAQDYRPGYGGDQQHAWQATLGPDAVCFTTHPARRDGPSPNYWTGSGSLPRVAQVENVTVVVYNVSTRPGLYLTNRLLFTHAWLPRDRFHEVVERDGWIFARYADAYLALRSQHSYHWQDEPGEDHDREVIVPGKQNLWICELGRLADDGPFDSFVARICAAPLTFHRLSVDYHSPTQGHLHFGWRGPLLQDGTPVPLGPYPRYHNPYTHAPFPLTHLTL